MKKRKLENPFILYGYYGEEYFCDREQELKTLQDHFKNERNVVLFSWRRMGKTALISHFFYHLEEKKTIETLYIDLLATQDMDEAVRLIARAVYEKYGKTSAGISKAFMKLLSSLGLSISFDAYTGLPVFNFSLHQKPLAEHSLEALGNFLSARNKKIVVALDEFQQVASYPGKNAEAVFRAWTQAFPDIRFIFSGSHRSLIITMFSSKSRPFYGSTQMLQIDPISLEEYTKFIKGHFNRNKKEIEYQVIEDIYYWSRKQTYTIQLICNKLYGKYISVTSKEFKEVCDEILHQESAVYTNFSKLLTDTQWKVLKAIASENELKNPFSKDFLLKYNLGATSSVRTAVNALLKKELIIFENKEYLVYDVLISRWLQRL